MGVADFLKGAGGAVVHAAAGLDELPGKAIHVAAGADELPGKIGSVKHGIERNRILRNLPAVSITNLGARSAIGLAKTGGDIAGMASRVDWEDIASLPSDTGKAVQFTAQHPGEAAKIGGAIGSAVLKDQLTPEAIVQSIVLGVATGGGGILAKGMMGGLKGAKYVDEAADVAKAAGAAGKVAKGVDRALTSSRAGSKFWNPISARVTEARTAAAGRYVQKGLEAGETAGVGRSVVGAMIRGTGGGMAPTKVEGMAPVVEAASKAAWQGQRAAKRKAQFEAVTHAASEGAEATADPMGYAMKKAAENPEAAGKLQNQAVSYAQKNSPILQAPSGPGLIDNRGNGGSPPGGGYQGMNFPDDDPSSEYSWGAGGIGQPHKPGRSPEAGRQQVPQDAPGFRPVKGYSQQQRAGGTPKAGLEETAFEDPDNPGSKLYRTSTKTRQQRWGTFKGPRREGLMGIDSSYDWRNIGELNTPKLTALGRRPKQPQTPAAHISTQQPLMALNPGQPRMLSLGTGNYEGGRGFRPAGELGAASARAWHTTGPEKVTPMPAESQSTRLSYPHATPATSTLVTGPRRLDPLGQPHVDPRSLEGGGRTGAGGPTGPGSPLYRRRA